MILLHPEASTWITFSRTGEASPTVRRPFNVRMVTPSRVRSVISKLMRLVYTLQLCGHSGRLRGGSRHARRTHGQMNGEAAPFARLAFHVDRAAVRRYNPGHEAQSQSQS